MDLDRIPSLNWLRVFEAAARHQGFAAAARELGMSTPAVSQQVRALEEHLRQVLFDRGARGVALTEAGRLFLPVVQHALETIAIGTGAVFGLARQQPLVVRVSLGLAGSWLAVRLPGFRERHPEVRLQLISGNLDEDFQRGGADLQIVFGGAGWSPDLTDELFSEVIFPVCTAPMSDALEAPEDLINVPIIAVQGHHNAGWPQMLEALALENSSDALLNYETTTVDSTLIALRLAAEGLGVALARTPASDPELERLSLVRPFSASISGVESYKLVRRPGPTLSDAARKFRDWLLEQAAQETL